jgi:hypothetical protein
MPKSIFRITSTPKFQTQISKEEYVFKGTLEDILYKFGSKSSNPLVGYVFKGIHYVYKFYLWNGVGWEEVPDPRKR